MITSTILLKTPTLLPSMASPQARSIFEHCNLRWEQDSLFVTTLPMKTTYQIPALQNQKWLRECLLRSPVQKVYLDPVMDETLVKDWAEICQMTGKKVYLNIPSAVDLPQSQQLGLWLIKRSADWFASLMLLLVLSPLLLIIACLIRADSRGPMLFRQWRIGHQGQLFKIYKFRSMHVGAEARHHEVMGQQQGLHKLKNDPRMTQVGRWLRRFSLDELPQLVNVLRGEMSLVGPRPWAIYDAVRINPELQRRLNALPGITGAWQVSGRSNELDLEAVTCRDLAYLQSWTLFKDVSILLLTVPKVLFGKGAY
ncbi:MAG: heterocyst development glycosyltransferase HepC [Leptolyngbyaceae cyanobacterium]